MDRMSTISKLASVVVTASLKASYVSFCRSTVQCAKCKIRTHARRRHEAFSSRVKIGSRIVAVFTAGTRWKISIISGN